MSAAGASGQPATFFDGGPSLSTYCYRGASKLECSIAVGKRTREGRTMDTEKFLANLEQLKFGIFDTPEWNEICKRENKIGSEAVLEEILDKRLWTNAEIMWVVRRLLFHYGSRDQVLQKAPLERLMLNTAEILRVLYLIIDYTDPDLDDNFRAYICSKMTDAAWGVNESTRRYLMKRP
jgi:hypothetical protein